MRHQSRRPLPPTASPPFTRAALQTWLTRTWTGRLLVAAVAIKLAVRVARLFAVAALGGLDRAASVALVVAGGVLVYRLLGIARRRLLWRVRRRLILSYLFIGVVPILLLLTFFVVGILLLFFNISSYLVQNRLDGLTDQASVVARTALVEIQHGAPESQDEIVNQRQAAIEARYAGASIALVPTGGSPACGAAASTKDVTPPSPSAVRPRDAGPWAHVDPPRVLPRWVSCDGFAGVLLYAVPGRAPEGGGLHLIARAVALPEAPSPDFALIVDLPLDEALTLALREDTGIEIGDLSLVSGPGEATPLPGRPRAAGTANEARERQLFNTVTFVNYTDWERGVRGSATLSMSVRIGTLYAWLSRAQGRVANLSFGQVLLYVLAAVGALLLVIEAVALAMGLALARSITGSIHELFAGTERVRRGDLTGRIAVRTADQLGELAHSFNDMTASISELLREMAEKKRLEEELRIAREIQMSLLPQGPLSIPGLSVTPLCVPAREVGGDYYDILPLGDDRVGILIADVSGKGTSAAFYMAELKGLMLSLSRIHTSPRQLLIHANRIIAQHLDRRSFITMIYAIVDVREGTMTCARAGHTPLIYVPAAGNGAGRAQILAPDGMMLGLKIDDGERFEQVLQEMTMPLDAGDLFLFFTDGITDAMNPADDCFGEARLGALVEAHGQLPPEQLRARIVREVDAFVSSAAQHDDMTMIILRVEGTRVRAGQAAVAAAVLT